MLSSKPSCMRQSAAQGVAIVPTTLLRLALGDEPLLSEVAVELYATTARMRLGRRPQHGGGASLLVREVTAQETSGRTATGRDQHAGR